MAVYSGGDTSIPGLIGMKPGGDCVDRTGLKDTVAQRAVIESYHLQPTDGNT